MRDGGGAIHREGNNENKTLRAALTSAESRASTAEAQRDAANAKLESVHKALDSADAQKEKCRGYAQLAISNGLALGRIAVNIGHEYRGTKEEESK